MGTENSTKVQKDRSCLYTFITVAIISIICVVIVFVIFNDSNNEENFHKSYILSVDDATTTNLSLPLSDEEYMTKVEGYIKNTKKQNNFKIILEIKDKNNIQTIATKSIKRTLDRNESCNFEITIYTEQEPGTYQVRVEKF